MVVTQEGKRVGGVIAATPGAFPRGPPDTRVGEKEGELGSDAAVTVRDAEWVGIVHAVTPGDFFRLF